MSVRDNISECCKKLKLSSSLVNGFDEIEQTDREQFLLTILRREVVHREETRKTRYLKTAGFYTLKTFEGYVFDEITFPSGFGPQELKTLDFLKDKRNIIMYGNVGTGNYV